MSMSSGIALSNSLCTDSHMLFAFGNEDVRERERQTDRQTDRQRNRQINRKRDRQRVSKSVTWCFKPSQPLRL